MAETTYAPAVAVLFARPAPPVTGRITAGGGAQARGLVVRWSTDVANGRSVTGLESHADRILQNVGFRAWACPHIIGLCHALVERLDGAAVEVAAVTLDEWLEAASKELDIPAEKAGKILIVKDTLLEMLEAARNEGGRKPGSGGEQSGEQ